MRFLVLNDPGGYGIPGPSNCAGGDGGYLSRRKDCEPKIRVVDLVIRIGLPAVGHGQAAIQSAPSKPGHIVKSRSVTSDKSVTIGKICGGVSVPIGTLLRRACAYCGIHIPPIRAGVFCGGGASACLLGRKIDNRLKLSPPGGFRQ